MAWLIPVSKVKPGLYAVLGGNKFAFYTIHYVAMFLILIALISCVLVTTKIWWNLKSANKPNPNSKSRGRVELDFSLRFPLYLAFADFFWGISHFFNHSYLLVNETYPSSEAIILALAISTWIFLGYQQLMRASLAIYMYLRVVKLKNIDLGKFECRLHVFCLLNLAIGIAVFYPTGGFGAAGYWVLEDVRTTSGFFLVVGIAIMCTLNALATTIGYNLIKQKIKELEQNPLAKAKQGNYDTTIQCLNTFIISAAWIYCPLAFFGWAYCIQQILGVIEPFTAFMVILTSHSSGWVNAWGYFHNEKLKKTKNQEFLPTSQADYTQMSSSK